MMFTGTSDLGGFPQILENSWSSPTSSMLSLSLICCEEYVQLALGCLSGGIALTIGVYLVYGLASSYSILLGLPPRLNSWAFLPPCQTHPSVLNWDLGVFGRLWWLLPSLSLYVCTHTHTHIHTRQGLVCFLNKVLIHWRVTPGFLNVSLVTMETPNGWASSLCPDRQGPAWWRQ